MILLKFILIIFTIFLYLIKVLEFTYWYQLKEYRFDRMRSYLKETGWWSNMYAFRFLFPAKKARNAFILGILFLGSLLYSIFIYSYPAYIILLTSIIAPLIAFIDVSLLVWLTGFPVGWYRESVIRKAQAKLQNSHAKIIMVTGSYGKTTVKEYLYEVLKGEYRVAKTDKNMNTDIGVAQCILKNLKAHTDYFIAEVGAYRVGEIAKICSFAKPDYVIVTAFGNQHLDLYGSHANLVQAESEPLDFLGERGVAFINADLPEFKNITKGRKFKVRSYSMKEPMVQDIKTKLLGKHVISNLLPVMAVAKELGMAERKIKHAIETLEPVEDKLSVHKGPKACTIISDAGNSNVQGFIEAIHVASEFPQKTKIIISKGIIELGKEKEESYKRILKELATSGCELYTTDVLFQRLAKQNVSFFADEEVLWDSLKERFSKETLIVIEGKFSPGLVGRLKSEGERLSAV